MLNNFLSRCLAARSAGDTYHVVLGNEGGDMDSVIGGIYLAHFLTTLRGTVHIPLLNFPKCDLPLRNDVFQFLTSQGVDQTLLLSAVADVESATNEMLLSEAWPATTRLVLFDHNKLTASQSALHDRVADVVDHHADEHLYLAASDDCLRLVERVGSASTLVEELFDKEGIDLPQPKVLLAPIVMDTMNFDPKFKKTTPRDEAARDRLLGRLGSVEPVDVNVFYSTLNEWKFDTSSLTVPQALRRDYKRFGFARKEKSSTLDVGISSVLLMEPEVEKLYGEKVWWDGCEAYRSLQQLDALGLMYASECAGEFRRTFSVVCSLAHKALFEGFANASLEEVGLRLLLVRERETTCILSFEQKDATVSRKGLTPLLSKFIAAQ